MHESDLAYVRNAVRKAEQKRFPASVYTLWAFIVLAGFAMVDFAPGSVWFYWVVMGPAGGLVSGLLGKREGVMTGQLDGEEATRHALHWGGMLVFVVMAVLLASHASLQGYMVSRLVLLVVAFGWWTAGVHFDRSFLWLAGIMAAGSLAMIFVQQYVWTVMGVLVFLALTGMVTKRRRAHAR
jgi:hypothetical protein